MSKLGYGTLGLNKLSQAIIPILGSLAFKGLSGKAKGKPKRKRGKQGTKRKAGNRTSVQFKLARKANAVVKREPVLTHGAMTSSGQSGKRVGKRTYKTKVARESGIRKWIQMGGTHLLAKSGYKSIHVPFVPFRVDNLHTINDEKTDVTGAVGGADAYFVSGSTAQLSSNDSLTFKNAKLSYEIKNFGALPAIVTVFKVYARKDITLDNVPNQAVGQAPHVAYLYEGWKTTMDSGFYNYSGYDQISVTPSSSATSYTTGSVAHCSTPVTVYDSPLFCRYYSIASQTEYRLLPGDLVRVGMSFKNKKYTKNGHFRLSETAGEKVMNKGSGFLMFQVRGEPGYVLANAPDMDMEATAGMSVTTSTVTTTDASIGVTYVFSTGLQMAPADSRGHVVAIGSGGTALVDHTNVFGAVGNVAEDYVEEDAAV